MDGVAQSAMAADHVVLCAGQEAEQSRLVLMARGATVESIGDVCFAAELDAMRAIEGTRLSSRL